MNPIPYIEHSLSYLKARLGEPSTWVAFGASVAAVSSTGAALVLYRARLRNHGGDGAE
jgi:hypothetical protein